VKKTFWQQPTFMVGQVLVGFVLFGSVFTGLPAHGQCLGSATQRSALVPSVSSPGDQAELDAKVALDREQATTSTPVTIVGLWNVTFTSGGQVVDQGFDSWQLGGTEILNDTPPPATGNVCLGTWMQLSPHVFKLKHPSWTFDNSGNLTGTAVITEQVTVDALSNNYQGPYSYDIYDLNGSRLQHFTGTITGKRITVD
jgi:hypothetical protein